MVNLIRATLNPSLVAARQSARNTVTVFLQPLLWLMLPDRASRQTPFCFALVSANYGIKTGLALTQGSWIAMDRNVGPEDRVVRIVVALGLGLVIYFGYLTDTAAIVTGIVAAYLLLSGVFVRCIFYKLIGVDTSVQEQPYSTTDDRAGL